MKTTVTIPIHITVPQSFPYSEEQVCHHLSYMAQIWVDNQVQDSSAAPTMTLEEYNRFLPLEECMDRLRTTVHNHFHPQSL